MSNLATARFASGAFLVFMALASPLGAQDLTVTTVEDRETETLYVGRAAMRYVTESDDIIIRLEETVSNLKILGSPLVTTSVATRVDRSPIPASRFDTPSGYKNVPPEF